MSALLIWIIGVLCLANFDRAMTRSETGTSDSAEIFTTRYNNSDIKVIFHGDSIALKFEEDFTQLQSEDVKISIKMNGRIINKTIRQDGWYVDSGNGSTFLKNDNISMELSPSINLTIDFSTKEQQKLSFRVMNVNVTQDFTLLTGTKSFDLFCKYNPAGGEFEEAEIEPNIQWLFTTNDTCLLCKPPTWTVVKEKSSGQSKVHITTDKYSTYLSVRNIEEKNYRYRVQEPLTAYSGVYACAVETPQATAYRLITISSKIYASVETEKTQYLSGQHAVLFCRTFGYPLPKIDWNFMQKKRELGEGTERIVELRNEGQFSITVNDNTSYAEPKSIRVGELKIDNLNENVNRGIYTCIATNSYGVTSEEYFLRVRNRYAFAIPLTGIIVQFILLAICIHFCKSHKQMKMERLAKQHLKQMANEKVADQEDFPRKRRMSRIPGSPLAGSLVETIATPPIPEHTSANPVIEAVGSPIAASIHDNAVTTENAADVENAAIVADANGISAENVVIEERLHEPDVEKFESAPEFLKKLA